MFDDERVRLIHAGRWPMERVPAPPPQRGPRRPLTARDIAEVAAEGTGWRMIWFLQGMTIRDALIRERDYFAAHGIPLPASRADWYARYGITSDGQPA